MADEKLTLDRIIKAVEGSKGIKQVIATRLGCHRHTIDNYEARYATVKRAIEQEREGIVDLAEGKFLQAINNGEWPAIRFCLATLGKNRGYVERQEHSGPEGGPMLHRVTLDLASLSEQELDELERRERDNDREGEIEAGGGSIQPVADPG